MKKEVCIRQQADIVQIRRCKERISTLHKPLEYLSGGLELAGNPVRLRILFLLDEEQQLCVCDLSDILGMTVSAVSQHLRKLKDRQLIQTDRQAQTIFYSLTAKGKHLMQPFLVLLSDNPIMAIQ